MEPNSITMLQPPKEVPSTSKIRLIQLGQHLVQLPISSSPMEWELPAWELINIQMISMMELSVTKQQHGLYSDATPLLEQINAISMLFLLSILLQRKWKLIHVPHVIHLQTHAHHAVAEQEKIASQLKIAPINAKLELLDTLAAGTLLYQHVFQIQAVNRFWMYANQFVNYQAMENAITPITHV